MSRWRNHIFISVIVAGLLLGGCGKQNSSPSTSASAPTTQKVIPHNFAKWEPEIAAYEAADKTNPPAKGGILFIGSSTIRRWTTLKRDFPEHNVINRGFGGSEIADSTHFADRIIFPYEPRQIFLRAGSNDIHNGRPPAEVAGDFADFVRTVRRGLPNSEILFIGQPPVPVRWEEREKNRQLNSLVQDMALRMPRVKYIDCWDMTLTPDKQNARPELFVADQLHFNAEGYKLLAERVRPYLLVGTGSVGMFEASQDVGVVLHPGSVEFDAAKKSYTIAGSGENMWAAKDAFQFVWKKSAGDLALTADFSFVGESKEPHRKACLMIRQSLDADSPYVDVALHGDGLTSLQFRDAKGAATHEVQANVKGPKRMRLEKQGKYLRMYLAGDDGELKYSGAATRITFEDPFYVGLGVCAHNKDVIEKATFSNVEIQPLNIDPTRRPRLFSTLETQLLSSSDRRVVLVAPTRIEAARWLDNQTLTYLCGDLSFRIPVAGGKEQEGGDAKSGIAAKGPDTNDGYNNWFPQPSPDGKRVVFVSYEKDVADHPPDKDVALRIFTLETKRIDILGRFLGGQGTIDAPCWSPDGRRIVFVSYQFIP